MDAEPFRIEELAEIAALPPDHPRRVALEASARGRALLVSYEAFARPGAPPPQAGVAQAKAQLDARIARELRLEPAAAGAAEHGPREPSARSRAPRASGWRWSWAGALRPAFAAVLVVALAGGLWLSTRHAGSPERIVRGHRVGEAAALVLLPPRPLDHGAIELRWQPVAGADHYEVEFFGPDLADLARVPCGAQAELRLLPGALPAGVRPGMSVLWQVTARRGNVQLAVSEVAPLRIP